MSGRISPADIDTIKRVIGCIRNEKKAFNFIINKVNKSEAKKKLEIRQSLEEFCPIQMHAGNMHWLDLSTKLENGEAEFLPIGDDLYSFVHDKSCSFTLMAEEVHVIDIGEPETLRRLEEEKKAQEIVLEEQKRKIEEMRIEAERLRQALKQAKQQVYQSKKRDFRGGCTG